MKFELPGQLRGPECREVIKQANVLRRKLGTGFNDLEHPQIDSLTIILRVDGSLGTFGPSGVENIKLNARDLACDLVIEDMNWNTLQQDDIYAILQPRVIDAVCECFRFTNSPLTIPQLEDITKNA